LDNEVRAQEFIGEDETIVSRPISISQSVDGGSLEGYVVDSSQPQLTNYLQSQGTAADIISAVKNKYARVAIIRNMLVDEDQRGQGIGNELVSNAINNASDHGAQAIVLVSDTAESNSMNLTAWYESFGFEQAGIAGGDPVMVMEL
jgi:ribosomal protein S18 acetylase RimI-like enzyme